MSVARTRAECIKAAEQIEKERAASKANKTLSKQAAARETGGGVPVHLSLRGGWRKRREEKGKRKKTRIMEREDR